MRLIDADALKASIEKKDRYNLGGEGRIVVCGMLDDAPTIDAELVKHGHFERFSDDEQFKALREYGKPFNGVCSICTSMMFDTDKFCAECGAKMDLKDGENE